MLSIYTSQNTSLKKADPGQPPVIPEAAMWIDLLEPTAEEEKAVEDFLHIDIPTREEMNELEISNRLYVENNALYGTVIVVAHADSDPQTHAITFVLAGSRLITVRYADLHPFRAFTSRAERPSGNDMPYSAELVFTGLVEAVITRLADILETLGHRIDDLSHTIFRRSATASEKTDFQNVLEQVGSSGDLVSKTRESMVSLLRLIGFVNQSGRSADIKSALATASTDVAALSDHANFLSTKINFLLEATLGMINIEQNNIIKIFSIAAVVLLPPTLIATVYGMNFKDMPELSWHYGYPLALLLMVVSAILPYRYFKRHKWL